MRSTPILLLSLFSLAACGEFQIEVLAPVPTSTPPPLDCTFRGGVLPVLRSNDAQHGCAIDCHTSSVRQNGLVLGSSDDAVYANLMIGGTRYGPAVLTADAKASPILFVPLQSGDAGDPAPDASHPRKPFATEHVPEYEAVLCWIQAGAQND